MVPDSAQAHYQYANSLVKIGKKDLARKELKQAIQLNPQYVPARVGEIKFLVHDGDLESARLALANLKRDFGETFDVLGIEGWFALGTGDYITAENSFSAALKMRPGSDLTMLLSMSLIAQKKQDEAIALLQKWLEAHPSDVAVLLKLGNIYVAQNDELQARATYAKVIEISPNQVEALNNLAWLSRNEDLKQALVYARETYELLPNSPLATGSMECS